jgi:hypothetical protein
MDGSYQPREVSSCRLAEFRLTVDPVTAVVRYIGIPRVLDAAFVAAPRRRGMARVVGIDHLVIRVSDFGKSKAFYGKLFSFLGFEVLGDYGDMIG